MRKIISVELPPEPSIGSVVLTGQPNTIGRRAWYHYGPDWCCTVLNGFVAPTVATWRQLMIDYGEVELVHEGNADE